VTRVRNGGAGEPVAACALLLGLLIVGAGESRAQSELGTKPLIVYLDEERQRYLKFGTYVQVWARYTDMNPGSVTSDGGLVQDSATDISIRRFRASMDAQFTEHAMGYIQLGLNNLNFQSERRTSVDLLDAYAEYKFSKAFAIGGGKSAWNGLSRYSAPSPSRSLTLDIPLVALPTLNITDDLLRNLGVWFKGQVSRLDYRAIAFKPFSVDDAEPREDMAEFIDDGLGNAGAVSAYLKWQFFEHESNRLPFSPGTYLARKKVLAVGAGYEFQGDRTAHLVRYPKCLRDCAVLHQQPELVSPETRQRVALSHGHRQQVPELAQ